MIRRATIIGLLALLFGCRAGPGRAPKHPRLPNIVVLYADDLGYGDLPAYNASSRIPTPNLDRLAREGMRFTDAHSSSGICSPSRYALLTGRHHWRQFHDIVDSWEPSVLRPGRLTIADMLRARGYATACIGKWHLGWDWSAVKHGDVFDWGQAIADGPTAHGFDTYFGDDVPNFPPYAWIANDRVVAAPTVPMVPFPKPPEGSPECRPGPMVEGWRLDEVMPTLMRHAVAFVEQQQGGDRPFFLYFPFTSPHAPIEPTAEFAGRSGAGPYGDYVVETDAAVGAVFDALDRCGMADDTIVIFSSDNGPEIYAIERVRRFDHRSMGELRGIKRDVYEGGQRVPMLVRWPGVVAAGASSGALVGQVDVMATLAAITGFALPDDAAEDSFDLGPVWRGEVASVRPFLVHNTYADKWGVRSGDWLLIDAQDGGHRKLPEWFVQREGYEENPLPVMLFDMRKDPGQRHNLAGDRPDVVAELRVLLTKLREQGHTAPRLER
ncbi:MAG: sulfatase-like hydrolase/transferase [Planctomycetota bacterium]